MVRSLFRAPVVLAVLLAGVVALIASADGAPASAAEVNHNGLPPETPRTDIPITLDGYVYSTIQIGDRVIVAGEFTEVESFRNGPIVTRNNIFAYNINTGALLDDWTPDVNGTIWEMVADEETGDIYVGGAFTQVDGEWRLRVAKLDYDGVLDPLFRAEASAKVLALDFHDDVLYLGGSFDVVNGGMHDRIAAVDSTLGATVTAFDLQVEGDAGKENTRSVKALDVHPNGQQMLVVFNGERLLDRRNLTTDHYGVAFVDLNTYLVTDWRTEWYEFAHPRCSQQSLQIRDAELSPDGSMFAIVEKGNWRCDKVVAFNTADDGVNNPKWVTAMHDSTFSVAVTNNAVYAGGHFCFVDAHGPVASADAADYPWVNKPESCDANGNEDIGQFAARQQIAALDPATGEPLDWNPGSNAFEAVFHIEAIDRGLLIGQDRDRIAGFRTGLHSFHDFGGFTPPFQPPAPVTLDCTANVNAGGQVEIDWNALPGVSSYVVRKDNSWIATTTATEFTHDPGIGSHNYVIRYRQNGATVDGSCSPSPVVVQGETPSCTAMVVDGDVQLSWVDQPGVSTWQVRRDGGWLASTNALSYVDQDPAPGQYSYEIRHRIGGTTIDTTCSPSPITVAGETLSCTVSLAGAAATIEWNQLAGISTYQVRRNGGWLATTSGASYVDDPSPAGADYQIRYRQAGSTITVDCA